MAFVFLQTSLATLAAILGGILGVFLDRSNRARLPLLLFGATGTLLAVVVCNVLPEAKALLAWPAFLLAAASGYGLFYLFNRYVYHICPSCAFSEFDPGTTEKLGRTAVLLLFALGLHSLLDGMAVTLGDEITKKGNVGFLLAIALHKIPEGLALVVLLLGAGYSRRTALLWTAGIEATTVLGGVLGVWLLRDASPALLGGLFAHVGGGFLFLVVGTLRTLWENKAQFPPRPLVTVSSISFFSMALLLSLLRVLGS